MTTFSFRRCFHKHGNYRLSVEGFEGRKHVLTKRHFRWKEPVRWMGAKYPFKRLGIEKKIPPWVFSFLLGMNYAFESYFIFSYHQLTDQVSFCILFPFTLIYIN
ncbi:hypothetical protein CEXT_621931 [Caerostris extrusa]|uniref:Uncharacterized protein n=1 Tax=Caerostris extrusa TaxID=172846 RepID=A0AAV4N8Q1_CAEEX|nr:hypothetical protein CEXT_621931 [Caerostris extrusa]